MECPLCEKSCDLIESGWRDSVFTKKCLYANIFEIEKELLNRVTTKDEDIERDKISNMIFSDLLTHRKERGNRFYFSRSNDDTLYQVSSDAVLINASVLLKNYPEWMLDIYDIVLLNLYNLEQGRPIGVLEYRSSTLRRVFLANNDDDLLEMQDALIEYGYLVKRNGIMYFTKLGLERIKELIQDDEGSRTVFIAMAFNETDEIYKALAVAIMEAGFNPIRIDQVEHNNQIMPEIFGQIRKCRFLVMDLTIPNYGAYYEAGIARGMGKETILTCRSDIFNSEEREKRPHFDVAQQSTVLWNDYDDLKDMLIKRIESTID